MKKKEYTFADEAKTIQKRFPRRETDQIEKRDYKDAMQRLMQEQEQVRTEQGMNNTEQFGPGGTLPEIDVIAKGNPYLPTYPTPTINEYAYDNPLDSIEGYQMVNKAKSGALSWGKTQKEKATALSNDTWYNRNKKYLPTVASGLSTILGNALLARSFKSNYRTSVPKYSPEEINLEPQAEGFRKDADVSKAVLSRNARNLGLNAGQTMANVTAGRTMIDRNLGNLLTNLYTQQEGTNVGAANQFASQHMDALGRARMYDTRYNQMEKMNRLGYLSGMFNTIPGMASEYNLMNRDEETRRWWNNYLDSIGNHYRLNDPLGYNPQINLR